MSNNQEQLSFYRKMAELQEKLRKSEEERAGLEAKFQVLSKNGRMDEARQAVLRQKYSRFLEDDRRRKTRNERILNALDKVEKHTAALTAKTERLRLLRRHFDSYMARTYPDWRDRIKTSSEPSPPQFTPATPTTRPVDAMSKESQHFKSLMRDSFKPQHQKDMEDLRRQFIDLNTEPVTEFNTSRDLLSVTLDDDDDVSRDFSQDNKENKIPISSLNPLKNSLLQKTDTSDEEVLLKKLSKISSFEEDKSPREISFPEEKVEDYFRPGTSMGAHDSDREEDEDRGPPEPLHRLVPQNLAFHRNDMFNPQPHHLNYIRENDDVMNEQKEEYVQDQEKKSESDLRNHETVEPPVREMTSYSDDKNEPMNQIESESSDQNISYIKSDSQGDISENQYYPDRNATIIEEEPESRGGDGQNSDSYNQQYEQYPPQQHEYQPQEYSQGQNVYGENPQNQTSYQENPQMYQVNPLEQNAYVQNKSENPEEQNIYRESSGENSQHMMYQDTPHKQEGRDYQQENYQIEGQNYQGQNYQRGDQNYQNDSQAYQTEGQTYQTEGQNYQNEGQNYQTGGTGGQNYQTEVQNYQMEGQGVPQETGHLQQGEYRDYPQSDPQSQSENYQGQDMYAGVESSEDTPQPEVNLPQGQSQDMVAEEQGDVRGFKEMELEVQQQQSISAADDTDTLAELDSSDLTTTLSEVKQPPPEVAVAAGAVSVGDSSSEDTVEKQMATALTKKPASKLTKSPSSSSSTSKTPAKPGSRPSSAASNRSKPPSPASSRPSLRSAVAAAKKK